MIRAATLLVVFAALAAAAAGNCIMHFQISRGQRPSLWWSIIPLFLGAAKNSNLDANCSPAYLAVCFSRFIVSFLNK